MLHLLLLGLLGGWLASDYRPRPPAGDSPIMGLEPAEDEPATARQPIVLPAPRTPREPRGGAALPAPLGLGAAPGGRTERKAARDLLGALDRVERMQAQAPAAFGRRTPRGRREAIRRHGGSGATESAVERGLDWLAAHQAEDGRWDSDDYVAGCPVGRRCLEPQESRGFAGHDLAQTGLALLAFLGAGYHHGGGAHAGTISRGVRFLLGAQQADGSFRLLPRYGAKFFYDQAIATFALAEAYALSRDVRLRNRVRRAVRFIERSQNLAGGWNYKPPAGLERNDSSVTGWVVMALESARLGGVRVEEKTLVGAIGHFRRLTSPDGMLAYADGAPGPQPGGNAITAVGLLCRLLLGQPAGARRLGLAAALVAQDPPDATRWHERDQCLYYWYYGTMAAFLLGGEGWAGWNAALKRALLSTQLDAGHGRGSWPARSMWARQGGGRIYATALAVLCLEVYYKYVPEILLERARPLGRHWLAARPPLQGKSRPAGDWKQAVEKLYSGRHAAKEPGDSSNAK